MSNRPGDSQTILYLEPFYGGSHRDFADGLIRHSRYAYDLHTLPDQHWKQRIRYSAFEMAERIPDPSRYAAVFCGGLMRLADLRNLWRTQCPPLILYAHETQLSYPPHPKANSMDDFYFSDIGNMFAADMIMFNSSSHRARFLKQAEGFLQHTRLLAQLHHTLGRISSVVYPGCWFGPEQHTPTEGGAAAAAGRREGPLRIVWNHRWEFDKRPQDFLRALQNAHAQGARFELILMGEPPWSGADAQRGDHTRSCLELHREFSDCILHSGYVADRAEYYRLLTDADVVVSTAEQENFGISVVEAMYHGCIPLLPDRLSYPELVPSRLHSQTLYTDVDGLVDRITAFARAALDIPSWSHIAGLQQQLSQHMHGYSWARRAPIFDKLFDKLFGQLTVDFPGGTL